MKGGIQMPKRKSKRTAALIAFVMLLLVVTVGGTAAYLIRSADALDNTFVPAVVTCAIEERFDGSLKEAVTVRNTGNIHAYVRAAVLVNWIAEDGSGNIYSRAPQEGVDYTITWGDELWSRGTDGFWYYKNVVAPEALTTELIQTASRLGDAPEGYRLSIQILASAIQSEPADVVSQHWGVTNQNGQLIPK